MSLTAYSEFGLIVAAGIPAAESFLVPLAIAVSVSFLIAAPLNRFAHPLFERLETKLQPFERKTRHPDEQPQELGDANVMVFGMGRTGSSAYEVLVADGMRPVGLDADNYKAQVHAEAGRNVIFADAEDSNFWNNANLDRIEAVVLAMDDLEAKLIAARTLRARGFTGPIVSHALYCRSRRQDHGCRGGSDLSDHAGGGTEPRGPRGRGDAAARRRLIRLSSGSPVSADHHPARESTGILSAYGDSTTSLAVAAASATARVASSVRAASRGVISGSACPRITSAKCAT